MRDVRESRIVKDDSGCAAAEGSAHSQSQLYPNKGVPEATENKGQ